MAKADISLLGKPYSVACAPGQEARLEGLSRDLDQRATRIREAVGDIGQDRVLLIAALALLDELDAARQGQLTATGPEVDRAAAALSDAAVRIEALAARIEADT